MQADWLEVVAAAEQGSNGLLGTQRHKVRGGKGRGRKEKGPRGGHFNDFKSA